MGHHSASCLSAVVLAELQGTGDFQNPNSGIGDFSERNVRFGVREHGMGAISNGFALHNVGACSVIYAATFCTAHTSPGPFDVPPRHVLSNGRPSAATTRICVFVYSMHRGRPCMSADAGGRLSFVPRCCIRLHTLEVLPSHPRCRAA